MFHLKKKETKVLYSDETSKYFYTFNKYLEAIIYKNLKYKDKKTKIGTTTNVMLQYI